MALTADEEVGLDFGLSWLAREHPDLVRCVYSLNEAGGERCVFGGFAEVLPDRVTVLADVAERAEEIDVARARAALAAAEKMLGSSTADAGTDWIAVQQSITRAQIRLQAAVRNGRALGEGETYRAG